MLIKRKNDEPQNIFAVINDYRESIPVDVEGLIKKLGLKLSKASLDKDISGMIERLEDGSYVISVNANDHENRQRFTMAHELGHYLFHRSRIGDGVDDNRAYRSTDVGKYHNTSIGLTQEKQANQFAANLLMPLDQINKLVEEKGITDAQQLAYIFEVSNQAMRIRLGLE